MNSKVGRKVAKLRLEGSCEKCIVVIADFNEYCFLNVMEVEISFP